MMVTNGRSPPNEKASTPIEYRDYRVTVGGLPAGFIIRAETETDARRQLAIASSRLDIGVDTSAIELELID